jgi:type IV pilus assembly protein PilA
MQVDVIGRGFCQADSTEGPVKPFELIITNMKVQADNSCFRGRNRRQGLRGFTLIELMIVVAIIGILAAIAIPTYMDYTIRTQIAEGINVATGAKTAVAAYYQEYGDFPLDNDTAALAPAAGIQGTYVTSVSVSGADISIRYGNEAHSRISGETIILTAADATGSVTWVCASGGVIQDKHLPTACE